MHSIGKSGFCNRTRNPKTDFTLEKSVLRVDFNLEIQIRISWISFLPFDWEIRKRICKTVLVNSGLLFANYVCACKTVVLKDSISNPFSDFQSNGKNENLKTDISALTNPGVFRVRLQIRNLNPHFPIECTLRFASKFVSFILPVSVVFLSISLFCFLYQRVSVVSLVSLVSFQWFRFFGTLLYPESDVTVPIGSFTILLYSICYSLKGKIKVITRQ